jgi:hypothetical protein
MSTTEDETVLDRLQTVKSQYRRRDLQNKLDNLAKDLADLYLQKVVYERLLDISIEITSDLQTTIQTIQTNLQDGKTETVSNQVDQLETQVQEFESHIDKQISDPLSTYRSTVESMQRLNQKLSLIDSAQLTTLETFLQPGDILSRIEFASEADLATKIETASEVGTDHRETYESARSELFETYFETEYGEKVTEMMSDDPPVLESFDETEIEQLYDSDLTPYIELRFG